MHCAFFAKSIWQLFSLSCVASSCRGRLQQRVLAQGGEKMLPPLARSGCRQQKITAGNNTWIQFLFGLDLLLFLIISKMIIMNVWGVGKQEGWGREGDPPTNPPPPFPDGLMMLIVMMIMLLRLPNHLKHFQVWEKGFKGSSFGWRSCLDEQLNMRRPDR